MDQPHCRWGGQNTSQTSSRFIISSKLWQNIVLCISQLANE